MTEAERHQILLTYANAYWAARPQSEIYRIPEHCNMEEDVSRALEDEDWYCNQWPGRDYLTFFSYVDPIGRTSSYGVHIDKQTVVKLT